MSAVSLLNLLLTFTLTTFSVSLSENEALLKLKTSFDQTDALNSWLPTSQNVCVDKWKGVICLNGVVTSLNLQGMALSGTIDIDALREIPSLRSINFGNNCFSGTIPEFNRIGTLKALYLSRNQLSCEMPDDYFSSLTSMRKLWLDNNNFTGEIPESIMKLPHLKEVNLEGNDFSGPIPELKQPSSSLTSLNLSNNDLEGEIPESFSKFGVDSFAGNDKLCGKPLNLCTKIEPEKQPASPSQKAESSINSKKSQHEDTQSKPSDGNNGNKLVIAILVIASLIFSVVAAVFCRKRRERNYFSVLEKESNVDNLVVQVHVHESKNNDNTSQKNTESNYRKNETTLTRKPYKNRRTSAMGNLVMINNEKGSFGMADLMKAAAEVLGNGGLGSAYKAVMANGLTVVVKRMRESNKMSKYTFDSEMKRLGKLSHPNILTPLAYHYKKEEKLVVSEYMPKGSLQYLMHGDRGISHAELNWPTRLNIIKGITSGLSFIHSEFASYELPHGNLKSSNVLLNKKYEPLLNDYAFQPLKKPNHAAQTMFAYKSPEYTQSQSVSKKSDVYCLGIIILEIITGKFPSQYASIGNGGIDVVEWVRAALLTERDDKVKELIDKDISGKTVADSSFAMMIKLLQIGIACTESQPEKRLDMEEVIDRIQKVQQ